MSTNTKKREKYEYFKHYLGKLIQISNSDCIVKALSKQEIQSQSQQDQNYNTDDTQSIDIKSDDSDNNPDTNQSNNYALDNDHPGLSCLGAIKIPANNDSSKTTNGKSTHKCKNTIHKWTFKFLSINTNNNEDTQSYISVGIIERNFKQTGTSYITCDDAINYCYTSDGTLMENGKAITDYDSSMDTLREKHFEGDTITMVLNLNDNTLSYGKNGGPLRKAFDIKPGITYRMAVCLFPFSGDSISLLSYYTYDLKESETQKEIEKQKEGQMDYEQDEEDLEDGEDVNKSIEDSRSEHDDHGSDKVENGKHKQEIMCSWCNEYVFPEDLEEHMNEHNIKKKYKCECGQAFVEEEELFGHIYQCPRRR